MSRNPHFNLLCHLASIDSETDSAERRLIKHLGVSEHISTGDIERALKITENQKPHPALNNLSKENKMDLMIDFVQVVKKDGLQDDSDWNVIADFPKRLGYDKKLLMKLISNNDTDSLANLKRTLDQDQTNY